MSTQGTQTYLLPELLYTVFAHLQDDKPSLAACSLVARSWSAPARAQLFHLVELNPRMLLKFIALVEGSVDIQRAVRMLTVGDNAPALLSRYRRAMGGNQYAVLDLAQLHVLLQKLPGLHSLLLLNSRPKGSLKEHRGTLGHLQKLHARVGTTVNTIPCFTDLVALFESIACLDVGFFMFPEDAPPPVSAVARAVPATRVRQWVMTTEGLHSAAAQVHAFRSLRTATRVGDVTILFPSGTSQSADMATLIKMTSARLVGVKIPIDSAMARQLGVLGWEGFHDTLGFSTCARLEDVEFHMYMLWQEGAAAAGDPQRALDAAAMLLGAMPRILRARFSMRLDDRRSRAGATDVACLAALDWTPLRHALGRLDQLREAAFPVRGDEWRPLDVRSVLSSSLPEAFEKGQLMCYQ